MAKVATKASTVLRPQAWRSPGGRSGVEKIGGGEDQVQPVELFEVPLAQQALAGSKGYLRFLSLVDKEIYPIR